MAARKTTTSEALLPVALVVAAFGWLGWQAFARPSRGFDWRGYSGTVALVPGVVYHFDFLAPFSTHPDEDATKDEIQDLYRNLFEQGGARNVVFRVKDRGVHVELDQSWPETRTMTFGQTRVGPFVAQSARRIDGLEWSAP